MRIHNFPVTHSSFFVPKGQYCSISSTSKNLNSQFHMLYIYIYGLYVTIPNPKRFSQIYRGNHMDNCERTRTSIHPARRKGVCKRQRHSIAKGWKIARPQPETIPKNTILMDAKETSINHPQSWWVYGGCPHSFELGNYFHTYNFSL